jgi:probable F420-dependent oxidoreductase
MNTLDELGCYLLAGHPESSRAIIDETRVAEQLGLGAVFISERYNRKEAAVLSGAAGAASERIRIVTAATNHNTRHLMVSAGMVQTMQSLTSGRFTLGIGRGVAALQDAYGIDRVTTAQMEDFATLLRRLFRGELILGHDGPAGSFPVLHLDSALDEYLPLCIVAFGDNSLELAGRVFDDIVLHTYFTEDTTRHCVRVVKDAAEKAGRDPAAVRVWSCFATIGDHLPVELQLKKSVGRLGTYLQGYGDLLVRTNRWDPSVLARFREDDVIMGLGGALDAIGTPDQLAHAATLIPTEWLAPSATGSPANCVTAIREQFALGCDGVILHGSTPAELRPVVEEYRRTAGTPANT